MGKERQWDCIQSPRKIEANPRHSGSFLYCLTIHTHDGSSNHIQSTFSSREELFILFLSHQQLYKDIEYDCLHSCVSSLYLVDLEWGNSDNQELC